MRILCVIQGLGSGGAERQLVGLGCMLFERNYEVKFLVYDGADFYTRRLFDLGIEIIHIESLTRFGRVVKAAKVLREFEPKTIISYLDGPNLMSILARLLYPQARLIVSERNISRCNAWRDRLKFYLYQYADVVVANSESQGKFIAKKYPHLRMKLAVVTNFTDTDVFVPSDYAPTQSTRTCLCVARIVPQKNVKMMISALHEVNSRGFNLRIHWFGNLDYSSCYFRECLDLIAELNLETFFVFKGESKSIEKVYQKYQLFCLPSLYEGYPNVLCEAMSAGLPVIASYVSDVPYIVEKNVNGFLFDPTNIDSFIMGLTNYLQLSEIEINQMSVRNRKKAIQLFSRKRFVEEYIALIEG